MKPIHFISPALALLIAGIWIGRQRHSLVILERQNTLLQKEIAGQTLSGNRSSSIAGELVKATSDKQPIPWETMATRMVEFKTSDSMWYDRDLIRVELKLATMDQFEIAAAMDEIASLDLPERAHRMLDMMFIWHLVNKDPEFALTKLIPRIHGEDRGIKVLLSHACEKWTKKDSVAAAAWFDQQIAAGTFDSKSLDGKNEDRLRFEKAIIGVLLASNSAAANVRLAALPENQRDEILNQLK